MKKIIALGLTLGCIGAGAATNNYDLLGRKGSQMTSPMVYKDVDYSKVKNGQQNLGSALETKALAKKGVGLEGDVVAISGMFRSYRGLQYKFKKYTSTGSQEYSTSKIASYRDEVKKCFFDVVPDNSSKGQNEGNTRANLSGFTLHEVPYSFANPIQQSPYEYDKQITYKDFSGVQALSGKSEEPSLSGSTNVGIYINDQSVPVRLNPNKTAKFMLAGNTLGNFSTMPGYEMRASRAYSIVQSAPYSRIYATTQSPSNPSSYAPQIYMGLHTYGGVESSEYGSSAKNLDDYIYANRTVEIVAAGNYLGKKTANAKPKGNLAAKAHAVNAITVGALDPFTQKETGYTSKTRPKICDKNGHCVDGVQKPEVSNYSHFYMPGDNYRIYTNASGKTYTYAPYSDGTEAAAAYTAGMVSDLLAINEFYRWHPELVKAVLLNATAQWGEIPSYKNVVFNKDNFLRHRSYYWMGNMEKLKTHYQDGLKEIRFIVPKDELIGSGDEYIYPPHLITHYDGVCATISWLNSGSDIVKVGKLPQKFGLYLYDLNGNGSAYLSAMGSKGSALDVNYSFEGDNYVRSCFTIYKKYVGFRIVLEEDDSRADNYGQVVLGMDVIPAY
jgi:hypothetical protein